MHGSSDGATYPFASLSTLVAPPLLTAEYVPRYDAKPALIFSASGLGRRQEYFCESPAVSIALVRILPPCPKTSPDVYTFARVPQG